MHSAHNLQRLNAYQPRDIMIAKEVVPAQEKNRNMLTDCSSSWSRLQAVTSWTDIRVIEGGESRKPQPAVAKGDQNSQTQAYFFCNTGSADSFIQFYWHYMALTNILWNQWIVSLWEFLYTVAQKGWHSIVWKMHDKASMRVKLERLSFTPYAYRP